MGFHRAGHYFGGYDILPATVGLLEDDIGSTDDMNDEAVRESNIEFDTDPSVIEKKADTETFPCPITDKNGPNLGIVEGVAKTVGSVLSEGRTIVLESSLFRGATREVLALGVGGAFDYRMGEEFTVGSSPERLVSGDERHSLENVVKIVREYDNETTQIYN